MKAHSVKKVVIFMLMVILLTITYWKNCFDGSNKITNMLSNNSELLVVGTFYNEYEGGEKHGYGLGWYVAYNSATGKFYSEDGYESGYCLDKQIIAVDNCQETKELYVPGNQIQFYNGMIREITEVEEKDAHLFVSYSGEEILTSEAGGNLLYARVLDETGQVCKNGYRTTYESSLGLQGHVFLYLSKLFPANLMETGLKGISALLMGFVATAICWLLGQKYDRLMAGIFYMVFWLSPLVVAFGSNMYWMEGILFLPLLVGLWCSCNVFDKKKRRISYILAFGVIAVKSMCGYEYMTTVMLSLIVFLLADLVMAFAVKKSREDKKRLLHTIFTMGICAVLGFLFALVVHAYARGNGDIGNGLRSIYEKDVLRRTLGGNVADFGADYTESLNASVLSVVLQYFNFENSGNVFQLIQGIDANLFPVLVVVSVVALVCGTKEKVFECKIPALYIVFFLSGISWFVLGKSHSAAHPFLNYILWYFGYMQIMFYVIIRYVRERCLKPL